MSRPNSLQTARRHAEAALALMQRHAVPPTPANYAIWYEHAAGCNPALDRALAPMVGGETPFSPELAGRLRERFLGGGDQELRGVGQRLQEIMAQVQRQIGDAGRDTHRYAHELAVLSGELTQAPGADELAALVGRMLAATEQVMERNRQLESELSLSTQEIGELKRRLEQTQRAALTDPLTGLANRKHFEAQLVRDVRLAEEQGEPLSLLLVDVDHFKRFNDTHGHLIGDEVLKVVARTLKANLKGRDTAARYGGEEFAVILPQTALPQAVVVADHVRRALATHCLTNRRTGENFGTITVSVGAAVHRRGDAPDDLVERADRALYAAKRQGRNRVVAEPDGMGRSAA